MKWLARLKKIEMAPEVGPTKPTKPTHEPKNRGFVGFVGSILAPMRKTGADSAAAMASNPTTRARAMAAALVEENPVDWHELDNAYLAHHVNCKTCQAAGRGAGYSLRCGTGAALWREYESAASQPTERNNQKTTS